MSGPVPSQRDAVGRIARLPDHVIDQIAAGEVIERPASVVKELVENALDAGATDIVITCAGGGAQAITVTDNGCGMSMAEAHLALMRHATSKLRRTEDLLQLATLGFRGEALPSIASVSRMTITTRRADDLAGVRLRIEGGVVQDQAPHGAAVGTSIEVRDLLFNQPARQKFLKSEATELSHIADWVLRLALAHPEVGFVLRHEGREIFELSPGDQRQRVLAALGLRWQPHLLDVTAEIDGVRLRAHVTDASQAQLSGRSLHVFVGRRWVRDRGLAHAVAMAYGEQLPRGRFPLGAVFLDVPPGGSDINVHPQKLEVRFADASAIYAAVRRALRPVVDRSMSPISYAASSSGQLAAASSVQLSSAMAARYVASVTRPKPPARTAAASISTSAPPRAAPLAMAPMAREPSPRWQDLAASFVPHAVYWTRFVVGACDEGLVVIDMRRAVLTAMQTQRWRGDAPPPGDIARAVEAALATLEVASFHALVEACADDLADAVCVLDAAGLQALVKARP
ncbi:MAG: DNA mismatch repair endonuclease MutL [Myxococcales bacterium]|nr:DNA mismatch repair endonuclease MutL [Myxococcales bacterium]